MNLTRGVRTFQKHMCVFAFRCPFLLFFFLVRSLKSCHLFVIVSNLLIAVLFLFLFFSPRMCLLLKFAITIYILLLLVLLLFLLPIRYCAFLSRLGLLCVFFASLLVRLPAVRRYRACGKNAYLLTLLGAIKGSSRSSFALARFGGDLSNIRSRNFKNAGLVLACSSWKKGGSPVEFAIL